MTPPVSILSTAYDPERIHAMQLAQHRHDELYHRDIARLDLKGRLTHLALHFAKYAGYMAEDVDPETERKAMTDVLVIAVSSANALGLDLHGRIDDAPPGVSIHAVEDFARLLTIHAGRMAAACERLDHLEDFPYRSAIADASTALACASLRMCLRRGWEPEDLVRQRLEPVRERSIFHDHLKALPGTTPA